MIPFTFVFELSDMMRNTRQGPLGYEGSDVPHLTTTHGDHEGFPGG